MEHAAAVGSGSTVVMTAAAVAVFIIQMKLKQYRQRCELDLWEGTAVEKLHFFCKVWGGGGDGSAATAVAMVKYLDEHNAGHHDRVGSRKVVTTLQPTDGQTNLFGGRYLLYESRQPTDR